MGTSPVDVLARPLPSNLEAERSILGAVLLDNHALIAATQVLTANDFFLPQNRRIFEHMVQLGEKQQPIDSITLMEDLSRAGELEASGGVAYLSSLTDGLPRVTNVPHYARIVIGKSAMRGLIHSAYAIQEQALAAGDDAEAILARAATEISRLRSGTGLATEPAAWREIFHSFDDFENCPPLSFSIGGFLQNEGATSSRAVQILVSSTPASTI